MAKRADRLGNGEKRPRVVTGNEKINLLPYVKVEVMWNGGRREHWGSYGNYVQRLLLLASREHVTR